MAPTTGVVSADRTVGGHHTAQGWRIVAALAVTQTVGYGTLYYALAAAGMLTRAEVDGVRQHGWRRARAGRSTP